MFVFESSGVTTMHRGCYWRRKYNFVQIISLVAGHFLLSLPHSERNPFSDVTCTHSLLFIIPEHTHHFYNWDATSRALVFALLMSELTNSSGEILKLFYVMYLNNFSFHSQIFNFISNTKLNPSYIVRLFRIL